jgi:hypothetical protein
LLYRFTSLIEARSEADKGKTGAAELMTSAQSNGSLEITPPPRQTHIGTAHTIQDRHFYAS